MINVNLLPPDIKGEITQVKKNRKVVFVFWRLVAIIIVYGCFFGGFYYYLNTNLEAASENLANKEEETKEYGTLETEAKKAADRLTTIKQIGDNSNVWSGLIDEVMQIVPSGVSLTSVKIDPSSKNRNQIAGEALSKTEVASFRDSLEKSDKFQYVDIESSKTNEDPLNNIEYESFVISMALEKGALE